ncbi:putative RNA-directed DNA polymerase from transposon BS [Amphibalanus amphitrite]|uniref:Putative RNA-directed DNA polymerase from transposon BS n=1 Tax=Amphibalanus amphitrite TaxID=1232801 RepID=A0A6A4X035_AMPAM|nr:putative RNA-directed DNA polymerase from transposon BS [Amphibalanus amphitrite]
MHPYPYQFDNLTAAKNTLSQPLLNPIGIYQGSSLGPLLHNVYANDLPLYTDNSTGIIAYADDVQLYVSGQPRDIVQLKRSLEGSLSVLSNWYGKNGLKLNAAKTQLIVLGTPEMTRRLPPITINFCGSTITSSDTVKNLGVWFDSDMSFVTHTSDVVRRCTVAAHSSPFAAPGHVSAAGHYGYQPPAQMDRHPADKENAAMDFEHGMWPSAAGGHGPHITPAAGYLGVRKRGRDEVLFQDFKRRRLTARNFARRTIESPMIRWLFGALSCITRVRREGGTATLNPLVVSTPTRPSTILNMVTS